MPARGEHIADQTVFALVQEAQIVARELVPAVVGEAREPDARAGILVELPDPVIIGDVEPALVIDHGGLDSCARGHRVSLPRLVGDSVAVLVGARPLLGAPRHLAVQVQGHDRGCAATPRRDGDNQAVGRFGAAIRHQGRYRGRIRLGPAQVFALSRQAALFKAGDEGRAGIPIVSPRAHIGRVDAARPNLSVLLHSAIGDPGRRESGARGGRGRFPFSAGQDAEREAKGRSQKSDAERHGQGPLFQIVGQKNHASPVWVPEP